MKHAPISKPLFSPEQVAEALAAAPDRLEDTDIPYDVDDPVAVEAYWKDAVQTHGGGVNSTLTELRRRRGPQKAPRKVPTTIRFDADVLAGLKATGKGWQTRVNEAMREWLKTHSEG